MILVPSLRQPLNGNRFIITLLLGFLLSSCSLFKVAQVDEQPTPNNDELDAIPGKKVYDPETGQLVIVDETPVEPMDTIKWKDIPTDSIPPILSQGVVVEDDYNGNAPELIRRGEYGTEFYTAYDVAIILPFLTDRFNEASSEIYENSKWALNYYAGAKMALDELNDEGLKLNVTVMDSKAAERQVGNLLGTRSELFNSHLIIGPYRRDNVRMVAEYAKRNGITFISPHNASSNISKDNPNHIQVSPTLQTHCSAITRHARERYSRDKIVLVTRDKPAEVARLAYFQNENFLIEGAKHDSLLLKEYIIKDEGGDFNNMDLTQFIIPGDTTVFVVPSWSNETFVYSFLAYAKIAQGLNSTVIVYGMPQWMEYERVDFELYESMNVHVSTDTYLDFYNTDIGFFRKRYFDRYGTSPTEEAFLGYDVMLYFGRMLNKYGTKFQYFLESDPRQMLHTRFDFERVVELENARFVDTERLPIERFENKHVNILKFINYQFQAAN
jgi:hypothetical protein